MAWHGSRYSLGMKGNLTMNMLSQLSAFMSQSNMKGLRVSRVGKTFDVHAVIGGRLRAMPRQRTGS